MENLYSVAFAFREAIEEAIAAGDITDINMRSFPDKCCAYASNLLQRYLSEQNVFTMYFSGQYKIGLNAQNHAWLETYDGIVIDITGDSFKDKTPYFDIPVYIGSRSNGFHDKFVLDEPVNFYYDLDPPAVDLAFEKRYQAVLKHLII